MKFWYPNHHLQDVKNNYFALYMYITQGIEKRESCFFLTHALTLLGGGYILTVTWKGELFGAIIRRDLYTLSLLRDSPRDILYACVI